jgi:hypothetical protein
MRDDLLESRLCNSNPWGTSRDSLAKRLRIECKSSKEDNIATPNVRDSASRMDGLPSRPVRVWAHGLSTMRVCYRLGRTNDAPSDAEPGSSAFGSRHMSLHYVQRSYFNRLLILIS